MVGVDDAALGIGAHPAAADEVRVAVDLERVLRTGGIEDIAQRLLRVGDVLAVVLALRVVHPRDRQPVRVGDIGRDRDAVLGSGSSSESTPSVYQWL